MSRPTLNTINSGLANWDAFIDGNFQALVGKALPIYFATDLSALQTACPANQYDKCIALVTAPLALAVSNGTSWSLYGITTQATLTNNTGGTASDTLAVLGTTVTGVDGVGNTAASKADVEARLGVIANSISSLASKLNALIGDIN